MVQKRLTINPGIYTHEDAFGVSGMDELMKSDISSILYCNEVLFRRRRM